MRKLDYRKIGVLATVLLPLSITCNQAQAAEWLTLDKETQTMVDVSSITSESPGKYQVWMKHRTSERTLKSINKGSKSARARYKNYAYTIAKIGFDCIKKQTGLFSSTDYTQSGETIESFDTPYPRFKDVIPESRGEFILTVICGLAEEQESK